MKHANQLEFVQFLRSIIESLRDTMAKKGAMLLSIMFCPFGIIVA